MKKFILIPFVLLILSSCSKKEEPQSTAEPVKYWVNTNSGTIHNKSCQWYGKTNVGKYVTICEGKNCGFCGGCK
jgi:hypothetical protein